MSKHTERSLNYMRGQGYHCWMTERFVPFPKPHGQRVDLFNIIDFLAIDGCTTIGVQSCGQAFSEHKKKLYGHENTVIWLENVDRGLYLIGWRKLLKKRGGKLRVWVPRIEVFDRNDFL